MQSCCDFLRVRISRCDRRHGGGSGHIASKLADRFGAMFGQSVAVRLLKGPLSARHLVRCQVAGTPLATAMDAPPASLIACRVAATTSQLTTA